MKIRLDVHKSFIIKFTDMKSANLFIGLGLGLLVGAAVGIYLASSDEKKEEYLDEINARVDKAKEKIGKAINDGLGELEKVGEKISQAVQNVGSSAETQSV
jgi:gas vesicle protein